jgi:tRNA(fMet)-specific endonuclease VapC
MAEASFLLDSNICIYILGGVEEALRTRVEQRVPGELVTSAIVYAEVMRNIDPADEARTAQAQRFFAAFRVVDFDAAAALRYRDVPFKRRGFDRLIAAHALALGLTVVTVNEEDFRDVPGLKVENWTLPL